MPLDESNLVQQFFRELEDPRLYERIDDVPIFITHTKKKLAPDGTWHTVKVDDKDLKEIGDVCKEMESKGRLPVITPGHRNLKPGVSEEDQPPPWGYARWLRPGYYIGPDGNRVKTLLGTQYLSKKAQAKDGSPANLAARTFPNRSVDYYSDTREISGLALLRRDPELDLPLIAYGQQNRPLFLYASENTMPDPTEAPDAMASEGAEGAGGGDEDLSPEEAGTAMRYAKHYERHHPVFKYMCDRYAAEQGAAPAGASPTNTSMPAGEKPKPEGEKPPMPKEPEMHARGALPDQYAREFADLRKELSAVKTDLGNERREKRLITYARELESRFEGQALKDEADFTKEMTETQFKKYLERVDSHSNKAPIGRVPVAYARDGYEGANGGAADANGQLSEERQEEVFQYLRENPNTDYNVAVKKVLNGQAK